MVSLVAGPEVTFPCVSQALRFSINMVPLPDIFLLSTQIYTCVFSSEVLVQAQNSRSMFFSSIS